MPDDNDYENAFDWYGILPETAAKIYKELAIERKAQVVANAARDEYAKLHAGCSSKQLKEIWARSMELAAHSFKEDDGR